MSDEEKSSKYKSEEERQAAEEFEGSLEEGNIEQGKTLELLAADPESANPREVEIMRKIVGIANCKKGIEENDQIIEREKTHGYGEDSRMNIAMQTSLNEKALNKIDTLKEELRELLTE